MHIYLLVYVVRAADSGDSGGGVSGVNTEYFRRRGGGDSMPDGWLFILLGLCSSSASFVACLAPPRPGRHSSQRLCITYE